MALTKKPSETWRVLKNDRSNNGQQVEQLIQQVEVLSRRVQQLEKKVAGLEQHLAPQRSIVIENGSKTPESVTSKQRSSVIVPQRRNNSSSRMPPVTSNWLAIKIETTDSGTSGKTASVDHGTVPETNSPVKNATKKFEEFLNKSNPPSMSKSRSVIDFTTIAMSNGSATGTELRKTTVVSVASKEGTPKTSPATESKADLKQNASRTAAVLEQSVPSPTATMPSVTSQTIKTQPGTQTLPTTTLTPEGNNLDMLMDQLKQFADKGFPLKKVPDQSNSRTYSTKIVVR